MSQSTSTLLFFFILYFACSCKFVTKTGEIVIKNTDDIVKLADDIYYGSKASIDIIKQSPGAKVITGISGTAIGYVGTVQGKKTVLMYEDQKKFIPKNAELLAGTLKESKTGVVIIPHNKNNISIKPASITNNITPTTETVKIK